MFLGCGSGLWSKSVITRTAGVWMVFFSEWCHLCLCFTASDDSVNCTKTQKKKRRKKKISAPQLHSFAMDITDRLASFSDCRVDKEILSSYAAAGFSYQADSGYIYCDMCGLTLAGLIKSATHGDPLSLHRIHTPHCEFLLTKGGFHQTIEHEGDGKMIEGLPACICFLCTIVTSKTSLLLNQTQYHLGFPMFLYYQGSHPLQCKRASKKIALDP